MNLKIGQLAAATGTQAETIRYYERQGLLPMPARTQSNYRVYDASHVERLAFIRHCRCLDMTLDEIRALLQYKDAPAESCEPVDALLDRHIGHVAARIAELKALERDLLGLRHQCADGQLVADCGILSGLGQAARVHHHGTSGQGGQAHVAGVHRRLAETIKTSASS